MNMRQISLAACLLAILASFVLSFSTWLALGVLAGFGALAVALPFCVDGYVITALTTWLLPGTSDHVARLARANLYGIGAASVISQASYHGWLIGSASPGAAALAVAVGALPPAVAVAAVHLRARDVRELASETSTRQAERAPQPETAPALPPAARPPSDFPTVAVTASQQPAEVPQSSSAAEGLPSWPPARPSRKPTTAPPKVDASGSGPRTKPASVDDVRPLVNAGMGRAAIAERLGIGTGAARALIESVRAESNRSEVSA
jgi:hypothetical protein